VQYTGWGSYSGEDKMEYLASVETLALKKSYDYGCFIECNLDKQLTSRIYALAIPVICLLQETIHIAADLERIITRSCHSIVRLRVATGNIQSGVTHLCTHLRNITGIVTAVFVALFSPEIARNAFLTMNANKLQKILNPETTARLYIVAEHMVRFFDNHNIDYRMSSGTMLGAKRHKGIIPWDDDMDVVIHPNAFDNFKSLIDKGTFEKETGIKIHYQTFTQGWQCYHPDSRTGEGFLKDIGTPFIDIFPTQFEGRRIVLKGSLIRHLSTEENYTLEEWNRVQNYQVGPVLMKGIKDPEEYLYRSYGRNCLRFAYQTMHHHKLNDITLRPWDVCGHISKLWHYGLPRYAYITDFSSSETIVK
jgi:hypothetical protein